ncbi:VOC family protein [Celeribacter marinus]|uniref:Glyoxalase family protein n=1 Tax=Celeribacter marinus TaxID=1397108 RepID=A0A0N9ZIE8_9RHOB|nr:VOC family protein [Celeribacter marinus]ALI55487.1 glyoxalase family protein [Celeribacter marinus]SFK20507.1 lactoylglutathione lyase [Celeribacter marinus]
MTLSIRTHGIILGTENYEACVAFYRDVIGLPVWYDKGHLVCLRFGDGYLMIESGGVARNGRKAQSENPTMLRFNVTDVDQAAEALIAKGVTVDVTRFDWGTVGTFVDPDGNACELKDADDPYFQR